MINFKLQDIEQIYPVGQEPNLKISWFWLTEAELWIKLGDNTIYEYTEDAIKHFETENARYCEYPLIRFIEDLIDIFEQISEDVPDAFFNLTSDIKSYSELVDNWLNKFEDDFNLYLDNQDILMQWIRERTITSSHLVGGTEISFFKNKDKVRIIWFTDGELENGTKIWTAKSNKIEILFDDFVTNIKYFKTSFFQEMDKQVSSALTKDWENIYLDKSRLIEEHNERKIEFESKIEILEQGGQKATNWSVIEKLYEQIKK
jgi:hypothetical protein